MGQMRTDLYGSTMADATVTQDIINQVMRGEMPHLPMDTPDPTTEQRLREARQAAAASVIGTGAVFALAWYWSRHHYRKRRS